MITIDRNSHSDYDDTVKRADLELDAIFAIESTNEAIDVAFGAVRSAETTLHSMSDGSPSIKARNEWRTHNVLVRQALRLVDERVQELAKAMRRLRRAG